MSRLPSKFYRVVVAYGEGNKLAMYDKKSGTYADKQHAINHIKKLRNLGIECDLFETGPIEWTKTSKES